MSCCQLGPSFRPCLRPVIISPKGLRDAMLCCVWVVLWLRVVDTGVIRTSLRNAAHGMLLLTFLTMVLEWSLVQTDST